MFVKFNLKYRFFLLLNRGLIQKVIWYKMFILNQRLLICNLKIVYMQMLSNFWYQFIKWNKYKHILNISGSGKGYKIEKENHWNETKQEKIKGKRESCIIYVFVWCLYLYTFVRWLHMQFRSNFHLNFYPVLSPKAPSPLKKKSGPTPN